MWKEKLYAKMETLDAQICRRARQSLMVMPWNLTVLENNRAEEREDGRLKNTDFS